MDLKYTFYGSLAGAGATILILLLTKGLILKKRGSILKGDLETGGGLLKQALQQQAESIRNQIRDESTDYAKDLASRTGKEYLMNQFGLTEQNISRIKLYGELLHI